MEEIEAKLMALEGQIKFPIVMRESKRGFIDVVEIEVAQKLIQALRVACEEISDIMGNGESEWCSMRAVQALNKIKEIL